MHGESHTGFGPERSSSPLRFPEDLDQPADGGPPTRMRRLSTEVPVIEIAPPSGCPMWLVSSYRAVRAVLTDSRFAREGAGERAAWMIGPDLLVARHSLLTVSGARHQLLRRIIVPVFARTATAHTLHAVRHTCIEQLNILTLEEQVDLVRAYVLPASASFTRSVLTIPDPMSAEVRAAARIHTSLASHPEGLDAAVAELTRYAERMLACPSADGKPPTLVDQLRTAATRGEIAFEEARDTTALLLVLATDALVPPLIAAVIHLLRSPKLQARCHQQPMLWAAVALEACRYANNALVEFPRVARSDITVEGVTINRGDVVVTSTLAASWDESVVPCPAEFRVDRDSEATLTFGFGTRACLARGVVLSAIALALRVLFEALPTMRLCPPSEGAPWWDRAPNAIQVTTS